MLKKIIYAIFVLVVIGTYIAADYYLPDKNIYTITGSEVKRVDKDGPIGADNPADGPTSDVYYIYTVEEGKVRVFRNEDTRWSFPFYFKFNSADLQATAAAFQKDKQVLVTSYGWRANMFSWFPNILSLKPMDSNPFTFSFIRWTVMILLTALFVWVGLRIRRFFEDREDAEIYK